MTSDDREMRHAGLASTTRARPGDEPFRLIAWHASSSRPQVRDFNTAEAAFYCAQREPDFASAELHRGGHGICGLRRIDLGSASLWQIVPIGPGSADAKSASYGRSADRRSVESALEAVSHETA